MISEAKNLSQKIISGELIAYPTDTLWGLGCDALNESSVKKLNKLKGRKENRPLSCLVRDIHMAQEYAHLSESDILLMSTLWPGPVTFLVRAKENIPSWVCCNSEFVGLRCSPQNLIKETFRHVNGPIVTTSANESGNDNCKSYEDLDWLKDQVYLVSEDYMENDLYENPIGSLILKIENKNLEIIREGFLGIYEIKKICDSMGYALTSCN